MGVAVHMQDIIAMPACSSGEKGTKKKERKKGEKKNKREREREKRRTISGPSPLV